MHTSPRARALSRRLRHGADDSMERGDSGRADESKKRNPAKAGIKFVHFGGILQTAGDRGDRGAV